MGAAGDMLAAALLELLPDRAAFLEKLNAAGIPGVRFEAEAAEKCGIRGTKMRVFVDGEEEGAGHGYEHDHDHGGHDHDHEEHDHSHGEHEHFRGEHDHGHEEHDHSHGEHEHFHGGHNHGHEEHEHSHGEHEHSHGEHEHGHSHVHRSMADIEAAAAGLHVSEAVRSSLLAVYSMIAEAESHAHGISVTQIHFHEVGAMDAVADVTAVSMLIEELAPERICVSPVHVGSGHVHCAHGILPVPAPATAYLLRGVPTYGGTVSGELCTPTGAALLRHFADSFGAQPAMSVERIGYGMGTKDFPQANCVRVFLGETGEETPARGRGVHADAQPDACPEARSETRPETQPDACPGVRSGALPEVSSGKVEEVLELRCNIDDMTGEDVGYACGRLLEAGALDVWTEPIGMKKSRPAVLLCCLCRPGDRERMVSLIFRHTTTIGVRESAMRRYALERSATVLTGEFGDVRVKKSEGFGVTRVKAEYEDLAEIADRTGMNLSEVRRKLLRE